MNLLHQECRSVPYMNFHAVWPAGYACDPGSKAGLAFLASRLMLRGTRTLNKLEFQSRLSAIGSHLGVNLGPDFVDINGDCMPETLEAFLALLGDMLSSPALSPEEFERLKTQHLSLLQSERESDEQLLSLFMQKKLFGDYRLGNPQRGLASTISRITLEDCRRYWEQTFSQPPWAFAGAGMIGAPELERTAAGLFPAAVSSTVTAGLPAPAPLPPGLALLLVERQDCTQAQAAIAFHAPRASDSDYLPLTVANAAFGETFSSPLVQELRERRGWCYSVDSSYQAGPDSGVQLIQFATALKDFTKTLNAALELLAGVSERGLDDAEVDFAKTHLVRRYPFAVANCFARTRTLLRILESGRDASWIDGYQDRVQALGREDVNQAITRHWRCGGLAAVVVGGPSIRRQVGKIAGLASFEVLPWDNDWRSQDNG